MGSILDSIEVFDNARKKLKRILGKKGVRYKNIRELSMNPNEQSNIVDASTVDNLDQAFASLNIRKGDGCLLHLGSHGRTDGFYVKGDQFLTPETLSAILDKHCKFRPTVVLVSACYSGIFAQGSMENNSRLILTAARDDRSSFGCSPDEVYTFWDTCLILNFEKAKSWKNLYAKTTQCVRQKEIDLDVDKFSYPQMSMGDKAKFIWLPRKKYKQRKKRNHRKKSRKGKSVKRRTKRKSRVH